MGRPAFSHDTKYYLKCPTSNKKLQDMQRNRKVQPITHQKKGRQQKLPVRDFPGSPEVKNLHFQCRGHGSDPW